MLKIFVKEPDPKELVRKWESSLRTESRGMDRQIREIQMEEKKVQKAIKEAAKRGDLATAKMMAKEILNSRKAVSRLYVNKAHMIGVGHQLKQQLAMVKVAGTLSKSTEVMQAVSAMIKAPELQRTMMEMSKEMMKAGLIDEMMGEALDDAMDTEDMEDETEAEVQKVLAEIAGETLASMPNVQKSKVPAKAVPQQQQAAEEEEQTEMAQLQARLDEVRS